VHVIFAVDDVISQSPKDADVSPAYFHVRVPNVRDAITKLTKAGARPRRVVGDSREAAGRPRVSRPPVSRCRSHFASEYVGGWSSICGVPHHARRLRREGCRSGSGPPCLTHTQAALSRSQLVGGIYLQRFCLGRAGFEPATLGLKVPSGAAIAASQCRSAQLLPCNRPLPPSFEMHRDARRCRVFVHTRCTHRETRLDLAASNWAPVISHGSKSLRAMARDAWGHPWALADLRLRSPE
jgi:hypothetical protein